MEFSVNPLKRRRSQDIHHVQSAKIQKHSFPTPAHESFLFPRKDEALCTPPQFCNYQVHSDALNIFDATDSMMYSKDTAPAESGVNFPAQTFPLDTVSPQTANGLLSENNDMHYVNTNMDQGSQIVSHIPGNVESAHKFAASQWQPQGHLFPVNSFPLSGINSHNCPECASGKPGHIRHIGRWRLIDSS